MSGIGEELLRLALRREFEGDTVGESCGLRET